MRGIEQAVFGDVGDHQVDVWLDEHLRDRLGSGLARTSMRSGRVAPVFGAVLVDGRRVAVKVHRPGVDVGYLIAAAACQRRLADAGYPCPRPLDGPATTRGLTAMVETLLERGERGDGHEPPTRRAMAVALFEQLELLRAEPLDDLMAGAPAWAHYENGPWPEPHDPIFDFSSTPPDYAWIDELAERAAAVLADSGPRDRIGHVDWDCANLRFDDHCVSASYDWDSLAVASEPVLVGLSAGGFPAGGTSGADAPTPQDVIAFLQDYEAARGHDFTSVERRSAAAAATWVLAYNARCGVTALAWDPHPVPGKPLPTFATYRDAYLEMRW